MSPFSQTLLAAFIVGELACLIGLEAGERLAQSSPRLAALGARAYERKLRSLESVWPLTRLPAAIRDRDIGKGATILVPLILLKSALVLPLGLIALPWLVFASVLVPGIVAAPRRAGTGATRWALRVARTQVTSHVAAATVGFALTLHGPLADQSVADLLAAYAAPVTALLGLSLALGVAAGWMEARGVVVEGYLLRHAACRRG